MSQGIITPLEGESFEQFYNRYEEAIANEPDNRELYVQYANALINPLIYGLYKYDEKIKKRILKDEYFPRFEKILMKMNPPSRSFNAMCHIIKGNNQAAIEEIKLWMINPFLEGKQINNNDFVSGLVTILKSGFPGMWISIRKLMLAHNAQEGLPEMCEALEKLYYSGDNERIIDSLSVVIRKNKEVFIASELLGYTYYKMKMWKNAIACFLSIVEKKEMFSFFPLCEINFCVAYSYGRVRNLIKEEAYYRKALVDFPDAEISLNNLGYCLYKQKRYNEAQVIFEDLIAQKRGLPYASNNLVRTFLAMGRYGDAVSFIELFDGKIYKELASKANELKKTKGAFVPIKTPVTVDIQEDDDYSEDISELETTIDIGIKREQFTSEKVLEDELTARLERGYGAFGLPLTVYEEKNAYGRQYIIDIGRIDILAVDPDGNYYVIELKKDAGYGDAYTQVVEYVKWVEKKMTKKRQKVFGIICLNNPSECLKGKVRENPQISLYEYAISYTEVM